MSLAVGSILLLLSLAVAYTNAVWESFWTVVKLALLLGVLLMVLVVFAVAHAAAAPPALAPQYEQAAEEYWGVTSPPCSTVTVEWESSYPATRPLDSAGGTIVGVATVGSGTLYEHCEMWIGPLAGYTIFFDCALFAHEFGHWMGHPDLATDPPGQVVSEVIGSSPSETYDPQCASLAALYEPPQTSATPTSATPEEPTNDERRVPSGTHRRTAAKKHHRRIPRRDAVRRHPGVGRGGGQNSVR